MVLTHHRVGNAASCEFDRGVFAASVQALGQQLAFLKRRFPVITLAETIDLLRAPERMNRFYVLLTFDDGYLDNYEVVYDKLRAHSCPAVFFVVPELVGSEIVPSWDEIAFLVRNCQSSVLELAYPSQAKVQLRADRESAINLVLKLFKSSDNIDPERFLRELRDITQVQIPTQPRRFMNWSEIRELSNNNMDIGSHTTSHRILSKLLPEEQYREIAESKSTIEYHIGKPVRALAYPVGSRVAFTEATERLVLRAGYEVAFSFYGGVNFRGNDRLTDVRRFEPPADSVLFRARIALSKHTSRLT